MKLIQKNNITAFEALDKTLIKELLNNKNCKLNLPFSLAHATVKAYKKSKPHVLKTSTEIYYILSGEGIMNIDGEEKKVKADDTIVINAKSTQFITNTSNENLCFLCIVTPPWNANDEELTLD